MVRRVRELIPLDDELGRKALARQETLRGLPGKDGKDGVGLPGKDGIDGKDGKDGRDGLDGKDGRDGIDGKDGRDGIDARGEKGETGEKGDMPDHQWRGTELAFEKPDGTLGRFVDLRGQPGTSGGSAGGAVLPPILKGIADGSIPIDGGSPPESLSFTYNGDGTVSGINGVTVDLDFTYNLDGSVNTIDDQNDVRTFAYNGDGTVNTISIS